MILPMLLHYQYWKFLKGYVQIIRHYRNAGDAIAAGAERKRSPRERHILL